MVLTARVRRSEYEKKRSNKKTNRGKTENEEETGRKATLRLFFGFV